MSLHLFSLPWLNIVHAKHFTLLFMYKINWTMWCIFKEKHWHFLLLYCVKENSAISCTVLERARYSVYWKPRKRFIWKPNYMYTVISNKRYRKHTIKRYFVRKSFKKTNNFHFILGNFYGWILKIDLNCERLQTRFISLGILFAYHLIFGRPKITSRNKHKKRCWVERNRNSSRTYHYDNWAFASNQPVFNDPTVRIHHFIYLLIHLQKLIINTCPFNYSKTILYFHSALKIIYIYIKKGKKES